MPAKAGIQKIRYRVDWILRILFGAGGLLGMYFGAKMQKHISEKWIPQVGKSGARD